MIPILQEYHGMDLQEAVDCVGEMCKMTIDAFEENRKRIPSFGCPKLDRDVANYVQGLQDWIFNQIEDRLAAARVPAHVDIRFEIRDDAGIPVLRLDVNGFEK